MSADDRQPDTRLSRRLGVGDAVVIGLGSMIGAGVFAALGPAAAAAGGGLLIGLALAAVVAYCNATSSAQLAALYPASGGTYVYGRRRLGHLCGFLAGWGFVIGKTASCAAMALTFGSYVDADLARPLAVGAVVALTTVNLLGVQKTAWLTRVIVALVLSTLAVVVTAGLTSSPSVSNIGPLLDGGLHGTLQAGALLFFAFAGYARIATLGEEVRDPARTIPTAIPLALGITLVVYTVVAVVALCAVGPDALAVASAPLTEVATAGGWAWAVPVVRVGAAIASLGVLLSLLVGVSRTTFAMAGEGDLPRWLDAVHTTRRIPHRAEVTVAAIVVAVVLVADVRGAIGFSSFAVLFYYAVANASAFTLDRQERRWPRLLSICGLVGCVGLAVALPARSVIGGTVLLLGGALVFALRRGRHGRPDPAPEVGPELDGERAGAVGSSRRSVGSDLGSAVTHHATDMTRGVRQMTLEGEYEPSPWEPVAAQVADYERTDGVEGAEFMGGPCIILTSRGAKSGKLRKTPLIRVTDGTNYVVIGSMGGAPDHPQWVHNLRAEPHSRLQDGATVRDYTAREVDGDEKARWWALATSVWPDYDAYQESTERVIPLFVLEPRD